VGDEEHLVRPASFNGKMSTISSIGQVMESINTLSKERGRIIDFKELLYGYYRLDPRHGIDYILDMLLVYKKVGGDCAKPTAEFLSTLVVSNITLLERLD